MKIRKCLLLSMAVSVSAGKPHMMCYCHTGYDAMALMSRHGDALFWVWLLSYRCCFFSTFVGSLYQFCLWINSSKPHQVLVIVSSGGSNSIKNNNMILNWLTFLVPEVGWSTVDCRTTPSAVLATDKSRHQTKAVILEPLWRTVQTCNWVCWANRCNLFSCCDCVTMAEVLTFSTSGRLSLVIVIYWVRVLLHLVKQIYSVWLWCMLFSILCGSGTYPTFSRWYLEVPYLVCLSTEHHYVKLIISVWLLGVFNIYLWFSGWVRKVSFLKSVEVLNLWLILHIQYM